MNYIDSHAHIWTADTQRYPLAAGVRRFNMKPASFSVDSLLEEMKSAGVERAVLIQKSFYGYDNSYLLDAIGNSPNTFSGVAVIDQSDRRLDLQMRMLKKLGVRGFRIYPKNEPSDDWLNSDDMRLMFRTAAEEKLHLCCLMDAHELPPLDRMCGTFSDTSVVIDHLCRIGSNSGDAANSDDAQMLCGMARHKNVYVKLSAFYALGGRTPPYHDLAPLIQRVFDAFGPSRLMWGSDAPYQTIGGHVYKDSLNLMREGLPFLSAADKESILTKTAERLFF